MHTYTKISSVLLGLSISGLAHAQTRNYDIVFPSTPSTLATNVANWNYSEGIAYPGGAVATTPSPMFVVRGQSSSSDHEIIAKSGEDSYRLVTANSSNADFGFFLMNLDFQDVDIGVDKVVSYDFKILGHDTNATINPADWAVKYALNTTSPAGANFTTTTQSFSFADDNATWTTISGSFVLASGSGGSRGALLINAGTSGSGFTSSGSLYLADLHVSVASIPEPSTYAMFAGIGVLALAFVQRKRRV